MSKRKPATTGSEWLYHSMNAFNGSGYADKSSPQAFVESYQYYKAWRREATAVSILKSFPIEAMSFAEHLVDAREPGITPSQKRLAQFEAFKSRASLL